MDNMYPDLARVLTHASRARPETPQMAVPSEW